VLPTAELAEQLTHLIEHAVHGEGVGHSAHHDADPGDEHGCTGLVHLCPHQAQVTAATAPRVEQRIETIAVVAIGPPPQLADKNALEPPQRPPIG
jgi:hypothetical protein